MKRIVTVILIALLLMMSACAVQKPEELVEAQSPSPVAADTQAPAEPTAVPTSKNGLLLLLDTTADLDGDGAQEEIYIESDDNEWTYVTVTNAAGESVSDKVCYCYAPPVCAVTKLFKDSAGCQIVISGDTGSDDFITMLYAYENGALRSNWIDGYPAEMSGDGTILISCPVDIFGSYGAYVLYTLGPDLSPEVGSDYEIATYDGFAEERSLTVQKDGLTGTNAAGETVALPAGTTLLLKSSNLVDRALLSSSLGMDVYLSISKPPDGWQWYVNGVVDDEWFGELLYAG